MHIKQLLKILFHYLTMFCVRFDIYNFAIVMKLDYLYRFEIYSIGDISKKFIEFSILDNNIMFAVFIFLLSVYSM